jgi:hypothetical protein
VIGAQLAVRLALAAGVFATGCVAGWYATSGHYEAREAKAEIAAQQQREKARVEGERVLAELREQRAASDKFNVSLREKLSHAQLTVAAPACRGALFSAAQPAGDAAGVAAAGGGVAAGGAAGGADDLAGPGLRGALPAAGGGGDGAALADGAGAAPDVRLTLGAVSLWNSALEGRLVPAGACRTADPAEQACAADAGLSVDDAWDNHATNAASCAADRARLAGLIDYLTRR